MTDTRIPVLIAGSGPTGLVLALALSIDGIRVRLVDRESTYRVGSKGQGISPRSLELYHFLGVIDDVRKAARPGPKMRLYKVPSGQVLKEWYMTETLDATPDCPFRTPMALEQDALEAIMREHLARRFGVVAELGVELVNFEQSAENVTVHLKKHYEGRTDIEDQTVQAQYLVGADGGRSVVRKKLGLAFLGETRMEDWLVYGNVSLNGLEEGVCHIFGDVTTKGVMLRAPGGVVPGRWALTIAGKQIEDPETLGKDPKALEKFIWEVTGRRDIEFTDWHYLTAARPNIRMVDTFSKGRVFVAGDAAHTHSPTGGQGLNSSVQDSFNLGWKLSLVLKGRSSPKLLDSYNAERLPVITEMLGRTTELLNKTTAGTGAGKDADVSAWRRGGALHQLSIHYEWSAVVYDERLEHGRAPEPVDTYVGGGAHGLRAGDRAPDAPALLVLGPDHSTANTTRLFDLFNPAKHTVLLFIKQGATQSELGLFLAVARRQPPAFTTLVLVFEKASEDAHVAELRDGDIAVSDSEGHAFSSYATDTVRAAVVRPDAMVGAMVGTAGGLVKYFDLIFDV